MRTIIELLNRRKYSKLIGAVGAALTATGAAIATPDEASIAVAVAAWFGVVAVWGATNQERTPASIGAAARVEKRLRDHFRPMRTWRTIIPAVLVAAFVLSSCFVSSGSWVSANTTDAAVSNGRYTVTVVHRGTTSDGADYYLTADNMATYGAPSAIKNQHPGPLWSGFNYISTVSVSCSIPQLVVILTYYDPGS